MNLALPALLILLGLLPGIVFVRSYLSGSFPRRLALESPISEIALYVVCSMPIALLALSGAEGAGPVEGDLLVGILVGTASRDDLRAALASVSSATWRDAAKDYFLVLGFAWILGVVARRVVWASRLDVHVPALRMKHRAFYAFQGRLPDTGRSVVTHADLLCACPGPDGSRLYRGVVSGVEFSKDGAWTEVSLRYALRGTGRGDSFEWREIESDVLVVPAREIHSVNLRYFVEELPAGLQRIRWEVRWWFRALVLGA